MGWPEGNTTRAESSQPETALALFERTVHEGFFCYPAFTRDPWLDPLRGNARFAAALDLARACHEAARRSIEEARR